MKEFKDKINLLFVSTIGGFLFDQADSYVLKKFSEDEFFIKPEPVVFHGRLKDIFEDICYDYDQLPPEIREKFKSSYHSFEKIDGNLYRILTREYEINRKKK